MSAFNKTIRASTRYYNHFIAIVFSYLVYISLLTYLSPWAQDDYCLTLTRWDPLHSRYEGLADLIQSIKWSYFNFNPRLGHYLAATIGFFNLYPFKVLNPLVQACIAVCITQLSIDSTKLGRTNILVFSLALFATFILVARPSQTVFWMAGALNYSWSSLLLLIFLIPYRHYIDLPAKTKGYRTSSFVMATAGLLAGGTNEGTISVIIVFLGGFLLYKNSKHKVPAWAWLGFVGLVTGFSYMMSAPGLLVRLHTFPGYDSFSQLSAINKLSPGRVYYYLLDVAYTLAPVFMTLALTVVAFGRKVSVITKTPKGRLGVLYFLIGTAMLGALIFTPVSEPVNSKIFSRAYYGPSIAFICSFLTINSLLAEVSQRTTTRLNHLIFVAFAIFSAALLKPYYAAHKIEQMTLADLRIARKNNVSETIIVETYKHEGWLDFAYSPSIMLAPDPKYWFNQCLIKSLDLPDQVIGNTSQRLWIQ